MAAPADRDATSSATGRRAPSLLVRLGRWLRRTPTAVPRTEALADAERDPPAVSPSEPPQSTVTASEPEVADRMPGEPPVPGTFAPALARSLCGGPADPGDPAAIGREATDILYNRSVLAGFPPPTDAPDLNASVGRFGITQRPKSVSIKGAVRADVLRVHVVVDGRIVRVVGTSPKGRGRVFAYKLGANVRRRLPRAYRIAVASPSGFLRNGEHWHAGAATPRGDGALPDLLDRGWLLDKWGSLGLPLALQDEWKTKFLGEYGRFVAAMESAFGLRPYLVAGTLLGAVRDGDFIGHDDDMDVGYFSHQPTAEGARDEMFAVMMRLKADGWSVKLGNTRGFFKVGRGSEVFDVFPAWYEDGRIWMRQSRSMAGPPDLMAPPVPAMFRGQPVYFPHRAEDYLALHYGPGWRHPDPLYQEEKAPGVEAVLARLSLTPEQVAALGA